METCDIIELQKKERKYYIMKLFGVSIDELDETSCPYAYYYVVAENKGNAIKLVVDTYYVDKSYLVNYVDELDVSKRDVL